MTLMKELLGSQNPVTEEAASSADFAKFKRIWDIVEKELDHLDLLMKSDSNFSKLVEKLGGDTAILKDAKQSFDKVYDSMMDLHMSIGIAQDTKDE